MISFDLPLRTYSALNVRWNWQKRARIAKQHRETAYLLTPRDLKLPLVIRLVRIGPQLLDDDAVPGSLKAVRDGIADRLGIKDNDERVHWFYSQQRGKPKEFAVRVEVTQR